MVTKRKRSSQATSSPGVPAQPSEAPRAESVPADQPERRAAPVPASTPVPAPAPRKRTDAPTKAVRPVPSKKAVQAVAPEPTAAPIVKPVFVAPSESAAQDAPPANRSSRFKRATRSVAVPEVDAAVLEDAESAKSSEPAEDTREVTTSKRRTVKKHKRRWPLIVASAVLLIVLTVVAAFSWDRWLRYDDAAELQGEWQTHGSTAVVVIDDQQIKLTEDVAYSYTLDTGAKTLAYTFGNWTGEGRYRFSLDRSQLVIFDDDNATWFSTLTDDLGWMFDQAMRFLQGQAPEEVQVDEATTAFDRLSHDATATPREGTAVAAEEPQVPATTDEPQAPVADAEQEPTPAPETDEPDTTAEPSNSQGDADPGTPATPGGLFDVNDVAA